MRHRACTRPGPGCQRGFYFYTRGKYLKWWLILLPNNDKNLNTIFSSALFLKDYLKI